MDLEIIYDTMLELENNDRDLAYEYVKSVIQYKLFGRYDSTNFIVKALMVPIEFEE